MAKNGRKAVDREDSKKPQAIEVFIPEHLRGGGIYSNFTNVTATEAEVILNFIYRDPNTKATLVSKVVMSHQHAMNVSKLLTKILSRIVKRRKK